MSEANRVKKDPSLLTSSHPDIISASAVAYNTAASENGFAFYKNIEKIHIRRACTWIATPLCAELLKKGYVFEVVRRTTVANNSDMPHHTYALSSESPKGPIVADGAWQLLVPRDKRTPELPKVAVGTPDEIVALAQSAGIPETYLDFWRVPMPETVIEDRIPISTGRSFRL